MPLPKMYEKKNFILAIVAMENVKKKTIWQLWQWHCRKCKKKKKSFGNCGNAIAKNGKKKL